MPEVLRWKLKGFIPGVEGVSKALFQPWVVQAEDFDNVTRLFLDATERCVASERREKELQQRLTAADERFDSAIAFVTRLIECAGDQPSIATGYLRDILDALKPATEHPCPVSLDGCDGSCAP
ncbi:hypothetical protein HZF02_17110 [Pseudomonas yamanorum]|nr:hypothetical protein HZF02_17110 [Pseudomonas yamanorum]